MGTGLTPIHALPWPDGTERVMDGDNAIRALAEAVDRELEELAKPPGIIVAGPLAGGMGSASPIRLPLDTVLLGPPSWFDNPGEQIVIPAGTPDGLYAVELYASLVNVAAAQTGLSAQIWYGANGSPLQIAAQSVTGQGAGTTYVTLNVTVRLVPGQVVAAYCTNPVADIGDWRVLRLTVRRIADVFGSSLLERLEELPQPEVTPA